MREASGTGASGTALPGAPLNNAALNHPDDLRLTWVQPEDLIGHELAQAARDGRDATEIERRWYEAGGHPAPPRAGASPAAASARLRALAEELLDELAELDSPLTVYEPTDLTGIRAMSTAWRSAASALGTPPQAGAPSPTDTPPSTNTPSRTVEPPQADAPSEADAPNRTDTSPQSGPHPLADVPPRTDCGPQDLKVFGAAATPAGAPGHSAPPPHVPGALPRTGPATPVRAEAPNRPPRTDADHVEWSGGPGARPPHPAEPLPHGGPTAPARPAVSDGPAHARSGPPGGLDHADTVPAGPASLTVAQLHAAWLGRAVGCLLGKPVEKLPLAGIRALAAAAGNWPLRSWFTAKGVPAELADAYPWNRRSAPTSLAENIDGMPEDDDLNYPLLNLLLLQRHGREFTTGQVARLWLDELPAGRTFTAERVAYGNLLHGIEPPYTAAHRNPFREWIGAAIRADVHGWTNPGDPAAAAEQAHRDAVLTHTGNGVYGAMFVAATVASAAGQGRGKGRGRAKDQGQNRGTDSGVHACLRAGLSVVPPRSRLADAVRLGIAVAGEHAHTGFEPVVDLLHSALGHYHWVHVVPNTALLAAALTHADGDFTGSICRAVSGGWDTDSNGATAGSVAGLLAGHPDRLPERWTGPLKNRLATSVGGFDGVGFDTLAELTHPLAAPAPAPEESLHP